MVYGEFIILKKISDGGILLNDWHQITITVKTGKISVNMYDKDIPIKTSSEKTIEVEDYTFTKGSVSVFVNGINGFFFDGLKVEPLVCWTPWEPKTQLIALNPNSNVFTEDFQGNIEERYIIIDSNENSQKDGPSMWSMVFEDQFLGSFIKQSTSISDNSPKKVSSILLLKEKNFCNGNLNLEFKPEKENGNISVIFKYLKETSPTGEQNIRYYSFDLVNDEEPSFRFRYFNNGDVKIIKSVTVSQIKGFKKAYVTNFNNSVSVEYANSHVTISVRQRGGEFKQIFNVQDDNIKCGNVGFGTFNTPAKFTGFSIEPLKLRFTLNDIQVILTKTFSFIPMPTPRKINSIAESITSIKRKMNDSYSAFNYLSSQSSLLKSTIGLDLRSNDSKIGDSSYSVDALDGNTITEENKMKNLKKDFIGTNWKTCVVSNTDYKRKRFCEENYNNPLFQKKCEVIL